MTMTTNNSGWVTADRTSQTASTGNLAPSNEPRVNVTVGGGGGDYIPGKGFTPSMHAEYRHVVEPDPVTGYTFQTPTGGPIPAGGPRLTDLVSIGGMKVVVGNAIRDGLIPDITRPGYAPQGAAQRPFGEPEGFTQDAPEGQPSASDSAPQAAADNFLAFSVPALSPMAIDSLVQGVTENNFDDMTLAYLQLEGQVSRGELEGLRDSFAAKIADATGYAEEDLEDLYHADREGFARAVKAMLKSGTADSFRELAEAVDASYYVPLPASEAAEVWRSKDFVEAVIASGIKVSLTKDNEIAIDVPGKGTVRWVDAVRQGLVKVSRAA